jgi:hypothetical protein
MRRVTRSGLAAALILIAMFTVASAAGAKTKTHARRDTRGLGVLIPKTKGAKLPAHGGTVDSLNWSGYAVTPSTDNITAVSSTFTVPSAALAPPGFAATWTGIGGYSTSDLIQAGASEDSTPSNPLLGDQYYAWYEILPASETQLTGCTGDANCTVNPGDTITVNISQVSGDTWSISMADAGHWTWSQDVNYASSESSGEWILEAPTVGAQTTLADVGTAHFGPTSTYTAGGVTHTIAEGDPTQIDLSPGVVNEATPSALASDGQSFNDCAYAQSCAAP